MNNTIRAIMGAGFCLAISAFFMWRGSKTYAIFCIILAVVTIAVWIWDLISSKKDK